MPVAEPIHDESLPSCPHLPAAPVPLRASVMGRFEKNDRGAEFYRAALETAQSLWRQGLPAQSLLQINRAMGADPGGGAAPEEWPMPYAAAAWVMHERRGDQFIGNPRRHYQHLATRMVEPRRELRSWRAWACWALAREILPDMPADDVQIAKEGLIEPQPGDIAANLERLGIRGETALWRATLQTARQP